VIFTLLLIKWAAKLHLEFRVKRPWNKKEKIIDIKMARSKLKLKVKEIN